MKTRRHTLHQLLSLGLVFSLPACDAQNKLEKKFMKNEVVMDAVFFNYSDRQTFSVLLNGKHVGDAGSGHGVITGVSIPLGPQTLTWRDAGNGQTYTAKNAMTLTREQIPTDANYIGIHIYPDDTFELTFSKYLPDPTERGHKINEEAKHHVK